MQRKWQSRQPQSPPVESTTSEIATDEAKEVMSCTHMNFKDFPM